MRKGGRKARGRPGVDVEGDVVDPIIEALALIDLLKADREDLLLRLEIRRGCRRAVRASLAFQIGPRNFDARPVGGNRQHDGEVVVTTAHASAAGGYRLGDRSLDVE